MGAAIWWFELRGDDGGEVDSGGFGIVELPAALNPTGRAPAAEPGRAAPDFRLQTIDGGEVTLSAYRGRWVLINFWASWCGPCRVETPDLQRLMADSAGHLVVLGVNQQEAAPVAKSFVDDFGLTYPILLDRTGEVNTGYRVGRGLPISVLVDPSGVVRQVFTGRMTADQLTQVRQCAAGPGCAAVRG